MASKVQICNLALSKLGADRITSLSDNTVYAKLCNTFYDDIVEEVIAEGEWTAATYRATLADTTNTPTFYYSYEFQLPQSPKCLRVLEIDEEAPGTYEYRIEGDKLLANISTMKIRYLGLITDPQSYGPYLKQAIVSRLALELSYTVTGQNPDRWYERYERDLAKALAADGKQGAKEMIQANDLTEVR